MTDPAHATAEPWITVDEAAEHTGFAVGTIYNRINEIPHRKVGRHLRFRRSELDAWIEAQHVASRSAPADGEA